MAVKKSGKRKSTVNSSGNYTKPSLRKRLFNQIKAGSKGGRPGQWSARKAQLLAQEYKKAGGGEGRMRTCLVCWAHHRKENKRQNLSWRDVHLRRRYDITEADYNEMVERQQNLCAICKQPERNGYKGRTELCVDHDHSTGKVRGLLCNHCNRALGLLGDNISSLTNAINYLNGSLNS